MNADLLNALVLLLIGGQSVEAVGEYCRRQGMNAAEAQSAVAEAQKRIAIAAQFDRTEELGKAVKRLEDLYAKATVARDLRTALQVTREINRLLSLYPEKTGGDAPAAGGDPDTARRLALIESYVLPLGLCGEQYPIEEHVRVACEIVRASGSRV